MSAACIKNCPGCGMTFSPDPEVCPVEVFSTWRLGRKWEIEDLKKWQVRVFMASGSENDLYRKASAKINEIVHQTNTLAILGGREEN